MGKTTIVATVAGKTLSCKVTVKQCGKVTKKKAVSKLKKVFGNGYGYFACNNSPISYKGKKYWVIRLSAKVEGHYSAITQYFFSTDGKVCREGYYIEPDTIGLY